MTRTTVNLFLRVRLADGRQARVKPALAKNHLMRPLWGIVNGVAEYHPEGNYVLRYRDQDGSRRWLVVGNKVDVAQAAQKRKETELRIAKDACELGATVTGLPAEGSAASRTTVTAAFAEYLQEVKTNKAPKTWASRTRVAGYFLESYSKRFLDEITRRDLLDFRGFLYARGLGDRTVFNSFQSVLSILRALGVTGLTLKTDMPRYTERAVRAYSDVELQKLFAACKADEELLFRTFLYSGCREQEVQFLSYADVDCHTRTIAIRAKEGLGFKIKDREERLVPVPQALVNALEERRKAYPKHRFVFPAKNGQPDGHMLRTFKKVALRAHLNCGHCRAKNGQSCATHPVCGKFTLHSFRRTFATLHAERGVPVHTLQRWLGHSDLETTLRYLAVADARSETVWAQVENTFGAWA
jgi:integrase/recombinase XerD